jgi:hypothetical protein
MFHQTWTSTEHKTQYLKNQNPHLPHSYISTPFLSPDNKCYLTQALAFLNGNPEVCEGVCLLGQPLGSQSFAAHFLMDKAHAFAKIALKQLTNRITSKQMQGTIF